MRLERQRLESGRRRVLHFPTRLAIRCDFPFVFALRTSPRDRMWLCGVRLSELQSCACGCQAGRARSAARRTGIAIAGPGAARSGPRGIVEAAWNTSTSHSRFKPVASMCHVSRDTKRSKVDQATVVSNTRVSCHDTRPDPPAPGPAKRQCRHIRLYK